MATSKIYNIFLLFSFISIQYVYSTPFPNTCEDQLISYRKFILTAVLNFEDICDATIYQENQDQHNNGFSSNNGQISTAAIRSDDIRNRPEVWAFFRMLMAQFKDSEFINILKDAIIEKCKEKSQNDKRDGVVIGKKQRFHSWGGKRANNNNNLSQDTLYNSNMGIRNGFGNNLEATKFGWNN
ncbi:leucokinin [Condylostylus longicornis]|uniref:leucokinin n=1 Tax=Condylostylus longicornis TaxID=2530218 RepID=UPI00244DD87F|nr:leucokinin [Condylostylus longicornis]